MQQGCLAGVVAKGSGLWRDGASGVDWSRFYHI